MLQGTRSFLLQDEYGQIQLTHSVSAGSITPRSAPSLAARPKARRYTYATDEQALDAFMKLARLEGIIPALECARHRRSHPARAEDGQGPARDRESLRARRQGCVVSGGEGEAGSAEVI